MEWYYSNDGQRFGPVPEEELQNLAAAGRVTSTTLVWRAGMSTWESYAAVRARAGVTPVASGAAATAAPAPARYCSECGQPRAASDLLTIGSATVCPNCKETYVEKLREGPNPAVAGAGERSFAGFWIRVLAAIIDYVIASLVQMIFVLPVALMFGITSAGDPEAAVARSVGLFGFIWLFSLGFACLYESWFVVHKGATPGKMALSLEVIKADGGRPGWGLAIGRHFAKYISGMILGIGYILVAFDANKRGLHDLICNTRVVRKHA